jgi:hypothetical protein
MLWLVVVARIAFGLARTGGFPGPDKFGHGSFINANIY